MLVATKIEKWICVHYMVSKVILKVSFYVNVMPDLKSEGYENITIEHCPYGSRTCL